MSRPAVQQFVGHYGHLGFAVVPLLPRTKRCVVDDWPGRTFGVTDFQPNANVGICSVNSLVVVDDDFDQNAVGCMDDFLPKTGAVYGRPQKPRGKRLYYCPDLTATKTFTDLNGEPRISPGW